MPRSIQAPSQGQRVSDYIRDIELWETLAENNRILCEIHKERNKSTRTRRRFHPNSVQPQGANCSGVRLPLPGGCSAIIGYKEPGFNPLTQSDEFCTSNILCYGIPTEKDRCCFGVLNCPVGDRETSEVTFNGVAHVRVNVIDELHTRVQAVLGESLALLSVSACQCSGGKILWKEPGTGPRWASILLEPDHPGVSYIGPTPGTIVGGPGSPQMLNFGGGMTPVCTQVEDDINSGARILLIPGIDCCVAEPLC